MRIGDGRVVRNFVTQVLTGEDPTVYGDGTHPRSFRYAVRSLDSTNAMPLPILPSTDESGVVASQRSGLLLRADDTGNTRR